MEKKKARPYARPRSPCAISPRGPVKELQCVQEGAHPVGLGPLTLSFPL